MPPLKEWRQVFAALPRLDAVFVPGGDPGHTPPRNLMAMLARQVPGLRAHHPDAEVWISPQGFSQEWLDEFLEILRNNPPEWFTGIVYGPQVRVSLPTLRQLVPERFPIRHYPDITHSRQCQYPVPDWDTAFALTDARECINPRPVDQSHIFRLLQPHTVGFITYSEGCNDDVNKFVWSALGWDPDQDVADILREYSGYFIGPQHREGFCPGTVRAGTQLAWPAAHQLASRMSRSPSFRSWSVPRRRPIWLTGDSSWDSIGRTTMRTSAAA